MTHPTKLWQSQVDRLLDISSLVTTDVAIFCEQSLPFGNAHMSLASLASHGGELHGLISYCVKKHLFPFAFQVTHSGL